MSNENIVFPIPKVAVIILNWNGKKDTLDCLKSISQLDYSNFEVIVVDNGSSDGSEKVISRQYPGITLLQTGDNLGYAGGNNVGIRWALEHQADNILLLNNDTTVAPDLLTAFIQSFETLPPESILGAKIYYFDKPNLIWFAGGSWCGYAKGFEHIGMKQEDNEAFNHRIKTDYITGCVLFAKAETFENVGFLEEDFFLTYEETDWCYRAKALGSECFVIPTAHVWHKVSSSFGGGDSPLITYFLSRNKPLWAKKNLPHLSKFTLHKHIFFDFIHIIFPPLQLEDSTHSFVKVFFWAFINWIKYIKNSFSDPYVKAKLIGLYDFYRGRFGNISNSVRDTIRIRK